MSASAPPLPRRPRPLSNASPCVGICRMDAASGLCEGCWRTLDEIAAWGGLDASGRAAVARQIEQRRTATTTPVGPDWPDKI